MPDRSNLVYRYDGTYQGFLCCVAQCFADKGLPQAVQRWEEPQATLFPLQGVDTDLPVTLEYVSAEENGQAVVVLRGDLYLSELTLLREQSAQIIISGVEGIRIPREALRIVTETEELEDGSVEETTVTGVYCVSGREAEFKPVTVLYSNESFALVEPDVASNQELLRLRPGDEVIVTAKDLYDGKVLE